MDLPVPIPFKCINLFAARTYCNYGLGLGLEASGL